MQNNVPWVSRDANKKHPTFEWKDLGREQHAAQIRMINGNIRFVKRGSWDLGVKKKIMVVDPSYAQGDVSFEG